MPIMTTPTSQPPMMPTALNTAASSGMAMMPPQKRGARMRRIGSTAIISMADSCSPAFIEADFGGRGPCRRGRQTAAP